MSELESSGDLNVGMFMNQADVDLIKGYGALEEMNRLTIEGFISSGSESRDLELTSYLEIAPEGDALAGLLRAQMLQHLGIPRDDVELPDLAGAWKHYTNGNVRVVLLSRKGAVPDHVHAKVTYTTEGTEVEHVTLLGEDLAKKEIRTLQSTEEEEYTDRRLQDEMGLTAEEVEDLTLDAKGKQKLLHDMYVDRRAVLKKIGEGRISRLRRRFLRAVLPISVERAVNGKKVVERSADYWEFLTVKLGEHRVDDYLRRSILIKERGERLEKLDRRLRYRRFVKDTGKLIVGAAIASGTAGIAAITTYGIEKGVDGYRSQDIGIAACAGFVLAVASIYKSESAGRYVIKRNQTPTFKGLGAKNAMNDELEQESTAAKEYLSYVNEL